MKVTNKNSNTAFLRELPKFSLWKDNLTKWHLKQHSVKEGIADFPRKLIQLKAETINLANLLPRIP